MCQRGTVCGCLIVESEYVASFKNNLKKQRFICIWKMRFKVILLYYCAYFNAGVTLSDTPTVPCDYINFVASFISSCSCCEVYCTNLDISNKINICHIITQTSERCGWLDIRSWTAAWVSSLLLFRAWAVLAEGRGQRPPCLGLAPSCPPQLLSMHSSSTLLSSGLSFTREENNSWSLIVAFWA